MPELVAWTQRSCGAVCGQCCWIVASRSRRGRRRRARTDASGTAAPSSSVAAIAVVVTGVARHWQEVGFEDDLDTARATSDRDALDELPPRAATR